MNLTTKTFGNGKHKAREAGKITTAYNTWNNMLIRCYDEKYQQKKPTYIGSVACEEWHNFQNFAEWFYYNYPNDGKKYCLDKDFKVIGNSLYSPETCMFIPNNINCFVTDSSASRGGLMIGVTKPKDSSKFKAYCHNPFTGSRGYISYFENEYDAHLAWRKRKSIFALMLANEAESTEIIDGLVRYSNAIDNFEIYKDGYTK